MVYTLLTNNFKRSARYNLYFNYELKIFYLLVTNEATTNIYQAITMIKSKSQWFGQESLATFFTNSLPTT